MSRKKRDEVIHLVTVSKSLVLLKGQINFLRKKGYNVSILSSAGSEFNDFSETKCKYKINMKREINIISDLVSLFKIVNLLIKRKPLIVNSGTPKAGLLGTLAGFITRVPIRVYTMRGLKLETSTGLKYYILWLMERICCAVSTDIICISPSIKEEIINLKLAKNEKITVLGNGSSNGINIDNFPLEIKNRKSTISIKGYNSKKFTIGYIGRIVKDKGIDDLVTIFKQLKLNNVDCQLLLVGSIEDGDPISSDTYNSIMKENDIIYIPHVSNPSKYYYLIDVFLFLTSREGFGNVSIESQAAKVPVITYNVTGARDTVLNGKTGYIVEYQDLDEVYSKIKLLYIDEELKSELGENARLFVQDNFSNEIVWNSLHDFYQNRISGRN